MTISSPNRVAGPFDGDGIVGLFPFTFKIFDTSDVEVIVTDLDGVETVLAETTDYTVVKNPNQNNSPGGSIQLVDPITHDPIPLTTDFLLTITTDLEYLQETDITNQGGFFPRVITDALDRLTIFVQQLSNLVGRSLKFPISDGTDIVTEFPTRELRKRKAAIFDDDGNITVSEDDYNDQATDAAASAAAAAASASSASGSAAAAAIDAASADADAIAAAASAAAAAAAVQSALWRDVVFVSSNRVIGSSDNGKLFRVDSSGGAIAITLPQISSVAMPFNIGIKKESSDGNNITITRSGTDLIDGATSKVLVTPGAGATLVADTDSSPDEWTSADFGATAGNMTVDTATGDGTTTLFNLTGTPGSGNNIWISEDGATQHPSQYSVNANQVTFTQAPGNGVSILFRYGTTVSIGTPSDGTVTNAKMANLAIATGNLQDDSVTYAKMQNVSAASRWLGRGSAGGAGDAQEGTFDSSLLLNGTVIGQSLGSVVNSVSSTYSLSTALSTVIPQDDTIPQITEGTQILSASITPKSATNKLRVRFTGTCTNTVTTATVAALFRDAGVNAVAVGAGRGSDANNPGAICLEYEVVAGSTAPTTFNLRIGGASGSNYMNGNSSGRLWGGASVCTLTVEEIQA